MNLLITGGCGFIGSNYIRYMLGKYPLYKIFNLDKLTYAGNPDNLKDIEKNKNYKFTKGDICDKKVVDRAASKVDCIINFAAETHVDRSILYAGDFVRTDVLGTYVLLEAARKYAHKRFVQISTDEVYGSTEAESFKEDDKLSPNSPYSAGKASAELMVRSYIKTFNLPAVITRSSNNFGPWQYPEKVIPLFVTNALEDKQLPLYGDGKNVRDWIYVLDNCEAVDKVFHEGKTGEIYNIGAGNEVQNVQLTRLILKYAGKPETLIKYVQDRAAHDRRYSIDCSKIRNTLGWKPKYNFEEALKATVEWYINNPGWWEKIKQKKKEFQKFYKKYYKFSK